MQGSSVIRCVDAAGPGTEVFQLTVPEGWVFYGGMEWSGDPSFPVQANFAVASPDGRVAVQFFPDHASAWNDDEGVRRSMPATEFVRVAPPPTPEEALREWVVRRYRQAVGPLEFLTVPGVPDPRIPAVPPDVQEAAGFSLPPVPVTGRVRVRYQLRGTPMEEEFWGQLTVNRVPPSPGMPFPYTYSVLSGTCSYRAPAGELDSRLGMLFGIQGSYRPNREYFESLGRLFFPDPALVQGERDPARAQATLQQHRNVAMQKIAENRNRWAALVGRAGQGGPSGPDPLVALLGYPPEGRLLGTVAGPVPPPGPGPYAPGEPAGRTAPPPPPVVRRYCPACGREGTPGANFCTHCGTRLAEAPGPEVPVPPQGPPVIWPRSAGVTGGPPDDLPVICPHCKAPMPPGSSTCRACGSPL